MTELNKEFREGEDMAWQFGCNLTCAGWEEVPAASGAYGTMYEQGDSRIFLDETGVFFYRRMTHGMGWVRLFGQSFDEMLCLAENQLMVNLTVDLMTGEMFRK